MNVTTDLLTVRDAASYLGLSVGRVHQFIYEGRLAAERVGDMWVIGRRELERFGNLPRRPGKPV